MSSRILFFGNERLATGVTTTTPVFRALIDNGYDVAAVIVAQNELSASRRARQLEIAEAAEQFGIPVLSPAKLKDAASDLAKFNAEIGVLVAYGKIVPEAVIDLFPRGIVNIHPSLLPQHRGPTPLESVILSGEAETGVSLMQLAPKMDAGPIFAQEKIALNGTETKQALSEQLSRLGADMLVSHLPAILSGELSPNPQQNEQATYDQRIEKSQAILDFKKTAEQLEREVRAFAGWPRSRATIATHEVIVTAAHIEPRSGTPGTIWIEGPKLGIHCQENSLVLDRLIPTGKKEMSGEAFIAGYRP